MTLRLDPIPWQQPASKRQRLTHNPRLRTANLGGDPVESDRLRPLFLAYIGKRSQAAGLREAGIDYGHGMKWLAGTVTLRQEFQAVVAELVRP